MFFVSQASFIFSTDVASKSRSDYHGVSIQQEKNQDTESLHWIQTKEKNQDAEG